MFNKLDMYVMPPESTSAAHFLNPSIGNTNTAASEIFYILTIMPILTA
jgi:hypothetical protein